MNWFNWKLVLIVPALIFFLAGNVLACDSCQRAFEHQLRAGTSESAHAEEFLRLMDISEARLADTRQASASTLVPAGAISPRTSSRQPAGVEKSSGTEQPLRSNTGLPLTGYVEPGTKPDKTISIDMNEGETYLGNGVVYKGFLINGQIPGPTLIVDEGDVVEFKVTNTGNVPHGVSLHAAYTQTSKHLGKIEPGETKSMLFRATYPGVYMYHCAPGGHAIPMHVLLGQYGMMVVKPKQPYRMEEILKKKPDVELYLLQHEVYASGKDAIEGKASYQLFNGKMFRYVEEPVVARPGDFIRINFLNVGPNLLSTFHIVGIVWDFVYWQGLPNPENVFVGGQSVLAGPTDSWVIDFRAPEDEGAYLMLNHAVGATSRGAIGILEVSKTKPRTPTTMADGPEYTEEQMKEYKSKAVRVLSPTEPSPDDLRRPYRPSSPDETVEVEIIGNSFYPKVIEIPVGTTVEWVNEDAFTYFEGEFSGIHNVVSIAGPEMFASPMLGHAERFSYTFTKAGEYSYLCTPHPYMRGIVRVVDPKSSSNRK